MKMKIELSADLAKMVCCCSIRKGCNDLELEQGEEFDTIYELTKTGKRKTTFVKLGNIENECHYFKDMNF